MNRAIERLFYPLPDLRRTWVSRLVWWESRRAIYNVLVGGTGVISLGVVQVFAILPPHPAHLFVPWQAIVLYGVMANVCYTAGWGLDTLMGAVWREEAPEAAPLLFRQGMLFSIGLTLLPVVLAAASWGIRILQVLTR